MSNQIAAQLRDELGGIAHSLAVIVGPQATLDWPAAIDERIDSITAELCSDDEKLAATAVLDVMAVLWPRGAPEPSWWRTPLGRVAARSVGRDDSDAVTHAVAADMLGLAKGSIGVYVDRGLLDRHPDGGVTRASVLARLARG